MTPEQVTELIDRYGRPAYELALRQVYIDALLGGVAALTLVIATAITAALSVSRWRSYKAYKGPSYETYDDMWAAIFAAGAAVGLLCTLLALSPVIALLNPEWAALRKLLPR